MKTIIILIFLSTAIAAGLTEQPTASNLSSSTPVALRSFDDEPEYAPIVERKMVYYDFTLKATDGHQFNLRRYAADKRLTIVGYAAGWCHNSNQNGHVIKRLHDKYRDRGLGIVIVMEYSTAEEISTHINRIGIDYPVVIETDDRDARKKSRHYEYRGKVGDKRKWGTPFYIIIAPENIEPAAEDAPLARRVHTVSGEIIESEADQFIERHLAGKVEKEK